MAEAVEILRQLFDGETVTFAGEHYQLRDVATMRSLQDHLPIMAGVNGPTALTHAAQHADIIGLVMLGKHAGRRPVARGSLGGGTPRSNGRPHRRACCRPRTSS